MLGQKSAKPKEKQESKHKVCMFREVASAFNDAQKSVAMLDVALGNILGCLSQCHSQDELIDFKSAFFPCIDRLLSINKRDPSIDRLFVLVSKFVAESGKVNQDILGLALQVCFFQTHTQKNDIFSYSIMPPFFSLNFYLFITLFIFLVANIAHGKFFFSFLLFLFHLVIFHPKKK